MSKCSVERQWHAQGKQTGKSQTGHGKEEISGLATGCIVNMGSHRADKDQGSDGHMTARL